MDVRAVIEKALAAYYRLGERRMVHTPRKSHPGYVRASSIGGCPLKAVREKLGITPDLPQLMAGGTAQSIVTLQAGEYQAMLYQEALAYYATITKGVSVEVEVDISDHHRKVSGRADAIVDSTIIEFKYTFDEKSVDPGEPREAHAWQLMSYARARCGRLGVMPEMYLVTLGKYDFKVWELKPEGDGFCFYETTSGEALGMGFGGWNLPQNLNFEHLDELVQWHHSYLSTPDKVQTITPNDIPIQSPLTDLRGYLCVKSSKNYKTNMGTVTPNCPWALSCHGIKRETAISRNGSGAEWELAAMKELW